jgi:hypothetical protein
MPPLMRSILEEIGNDKITSMKIVRTPIESFVKTLMNIISLGQFESAVKKNHYDSMFHLALLINGKYTLDKQEVLKLVKGSPVKKTSETMDIDLQGKEITFNELLEKTREVMGPRNFTNYSSRKNNCQNFVESVLRANDILTDEHKNFIMQDADAVFRKMPKFTEKLSDVVTDLGAVADRVLEGEGKRTRKVKGGAVSARIGEEFQRLREIVNTWRVNGMLNEAQVAQIEAHVIVPPNEGDGSWQRIQFVYDTYRNLPEITDDWFNPWIQYIESKLPSEGSEMKEGGKKTRKRCLRRCKKSFHD